LEKNMEARQLFIDAVDGVMVTFQGNANAKADYQKFLSMADSVKSKFEKFAIDAAMESIGLDVVEGGVSEKSVTDAINASLLADSGVVLTNIFDGEAIKRDLLKFALAKAAESLGEDLVFDSFDVDTMRRELKRYVGVRIGEQLIARGGDLIDDAPDNAVVLALIESYEARLSEPASDNPKAAGNRERQATYRAAHHRQWEVI
jgi:hypothetical protein